MLCYLTLQLEWSIKGKVSCNKKDGFTVVVFAPRARNFKCLFLVARKMFPNLNNIE